MEAEVTILTDKEQTSMRAIGLTDIAALWTSLTRKVGIHFHSHTSCERGFVGNDAMQFSKSPARSMAISPTLLPCSLLTSFAFGAFPNVCQMFQSNDARRMRINNVFCDSVIGLQLEPSLSSTDRYQATGSGTSAFLLQPLTQSGRVICLGTCSLARIKGCLATCIARDCQIPLSYIHTHDTFMGLGCWVCCLNFKGNQQGELLMWLVIPEFCSTNMSTMLYQCHMLVVATVGDDDPPFKGKDTDLLLWLKAVVPMEVIGERGRHILGSLVKSFVAFLGDPCLPLCCVLLHPRPEGLVGRSHLTRHITGHL